MVVPSVRGDIKGCSSNASQIKTGPFLSKRAQACIRNLGLANARKGSTLASSDSAPFPSNTQGLSAQPTQTCQNDSFVGGGGHWVIEVGHLVRQLYCKARGKDLHLKHITKETHYGLESEFSIVCQVDHCQYTNQVTTGKQHGDVNPKIFYGNTKLAIGD